MIFNILTKLAWPVRSLARQWRAEDGVQDDAKLKELIELSKNLPSSSIRTVSRAFSHFLNLANAAETHHRIRRVRARERACEDPMDPATPFLNSVDGSIKALLDGGPGKPSATGDEIYQALCSQCVEIVLTAHPTEVGSLHATPQGWGREEGDDPYKFDWDHRGV